MEYDLSGKWLSTYTIGSADKKFHYKHPIFLEQAGRKVAGRSIPDPSGSQLHLELSLEDHVVTGTWLEESSMKGKYKGQTFFGALQFIYDPEAGRMTGKWVGFDSDKAQVNTGDWMLVKQPGGDEEDV